MSNFFQKINKIHIQTRPFIVYQKRKWQHLFMKISTFYLWKAVKLFVRESWINWDPWQLDHIFLTCIEIHLERPLLLCALFSRDWYRTGSQSVPPTRLAPKTAWFCWLPTPTDRLGLKTSLVYILATHKLFLLVPHLHNSYGISIVPCLP